MTTPDERAILTAAVQICDENEGGASANEVAARLGVRADVVIRELLPLVANYFAKSLRGDDGVISVRQPTAEARAFARMSD